jgi:hypothetical protein
MAPALQGKNWLFQCVNTHQVSDDGPRLAALVVATGGKPDLFITDIPYQTPLVLLDDVHVRVDPTSLDQEAFSAGMRRGLFFVKGDEALVCAPTGQVLGWTIVNIGTGHVFNGKLVGDWLSFPRWSLVMDDEEGDELTLVSFGGTELDGVDQQT